MGKKVKDVIEAVIKKGHHLSDIHNFIAPYIKFRERAVGP